MFARPIKVKRLKYKVGGHPAPAGRALTNDLCSRYVKIKVKIKIYLTPMINDIFSLLPSDVFNTPLTTYVPSDTMRPILSHKSHLPT